MSEKTGIAWCDSTFNPWIGCTKISAGCANCYAERDNKRYSWVDGWGKGSPRKRTSAENWKKPLQWARAAVKEGVTRRVFCASLADVLDDEVSPEWRSDLFKLIDETGAIGGLEWLLLTKRARNIAWMLPQSWLKNPPPYVRMGVTAEDQPNWNMRVNQLVHAWEGKNFVSVEPMLGMVYPTVKVDWVICGCESGTGSRPTEYRWIDNLICDCQKQEIPFFLKQITQEGKLIKEPSYGGRQWLEVPNETQS